MRKLDCALLILLIAACSKERSPPMARLTASPSSGTVKTVFAFDGSLSEDPDGMPQLLECRWDFEGDGTWDTGFRKGLISARQYPVAGQYNPTIQIRDPQGLVSTASQTITIENPKTFTDPRDGKTYPIAQFGNLWWMGRNLDYGITIDPSVNSTDNGIVEKYRYPGEDPDSLYGGLYQWSEAMEYHPTTGIQGICPPGWRISTDVDWHSLMALFRDPNSPAPVVYRITGNAFVPDQLVQHYNYQATGAIRKLLRSTGDTGFDAVMVGYRDPDGHFGNQDYHFAGETASFWTATPDNTLAIRNRFYDDNNGQAEIFRFSDDRRYAFSIRCVKDVQ